MTTSKKPTKRLDPKAIDRPFDPDILRRAEAIAAEYQVVMRFEDGEFYGRGVELPGAMDDGRTADECMNNTRSALVALVAYMLEQGETPPKPAGAGVRDQHVTVPVSSAELLALKASAAQKGYRDTAAYVRAAVAAFEPKPNRRLSLVKRPSGHASVRQERMKTSGGPRA